MDELKKTTANNGNAEDEISVSPRFSKDLHMLLEPKAAIPSEIDRKIQRKARRYFRRRRAWRLVRYPAAAAVIAAAGFIGMAVLNRPGVSDSIRSGTGQVCREDIDRNGTVDIRDALFLARKVESQAEINRQWDINQDGLVNRVDADRVAMVAVNLSRQETL